MQRERTAATEALRAFLGTLQISLHLRSPA